MKAAKSLFRRSGKDGMKVLSALNLPLPFGSAGAIHWFNTIWHMAEAGAKVKVLGGVSPEADNDSVLDFYGLKPHHRLSISFTKPLPSSYLDRSEKLRTRAYFIELLRTIRKYKPKVVFGIGMPNHLRALGLLKRSQPFRVVLELHEDHTSSSRLEACIRLARGASPALDGIVTVSPAHRDLLIEQGIPEDRVHTFYAAHRPDLLPNGERHELLSKLNLPIGKGEKVVLYGGNLYGDRGVDDLLKAFQQVAKKLPNVHLVLLGAGEPELLSRLKAMVGDDGLSSRVHFTGRVPPTAVGTYLAAADVGVVPNPDRAQWGFGSPIKLSEYLGSGLPVVATNLRTTSGLVSPEGAAILVGPEAPHEMAEALVKVLTDDDLRLSLRNRATEIGEKLTYRARAESIYRFLGHLVVKNHPTLFRRFLQSLPTNRNPI